MSEMGGQTRKSGDGIATSDLPLKTDIKRSSREVRGVPTTEVTDSRIFLFCEPRIGTGALSSFSSLRLLQPLKADVREAGDLS
jgi:hypothetical protein